MTFDLSLLIAWTLLTNSHFQNFPDNFDPKGYSLQFNLLLIDNELYTKKELTIEYQNNITFFVEANKLYHYFKDVPRIHDGDFIERFDTSKAKTLRKAYSKRWYLLQDICEVGGGMLPERLRAEMDFCNQMYYLYDAIILYKESRGMRIKRSCLHSIKTIIGDENFYNKIYLEIY